MSGVSGAACRQTRGSLLAVPHSCDDEHMAEDRAPAATPPPRWRRPVGGRLGVRSIFYGLAALLTALALIARAASAPPIVIFFVSALAMAILAWLVGVATEHLGAATGPKVSGVLNSTFGNLAELVITFFALRAGLTTVVKASITGSILGNVLLVLGASILLGSLRHGRLHFSRHLAGLNASLLTIAVIGLAVPAVFAKSLNPSGGNAVEHLSVGVAIIFMLTYILSLIFFFRTPEAGGEERSRLQVEWPIGRSLLILALTGVGITVVSDILVDAIRPTLATLHMSELFAGVVIVPIIGNISENLVSLQLAYQNDMNFSMVVSLGSSLQVALFVAPMLVFLSLIIGRPIDLVFTPLELVTVGFGSLIMALIAGDGESNWLEGAELVAVYVIVALAFFFYPS
jgi:Ca2+:H+ antiporter